MSQDNQEGPVFREVNRQRPTRHASVSSVPSVNPIALPETSNRASYTETQLPETKNPRPTAPNIENLQALAPETSNDGPGPNFVDVSPRKYRQVSHTIDPYNNAPEAIQVSNESPAPNFVEPPPAKPRQTLRPTGPNVAALQIPQAANEGFTPNFVETRTGGPRRTPRTAESKSDNGEEPHLVTSSRPGRICRSIASSDEEDTTNGERDSPLAMASKLNTFDVASLIINKMIGTGIVTGPAQVLFYTRRKDYALLLWGLGFLYTLVSVVIFVEFGYKFKVTGGELVYLDEIFKRPRLLFVTIFSFQFILFWNTATNCAQAARQILACADNNLDTDDVFRNLNDDSRLTIFVAIVILVCVCLLHYFSTAAGRVTNIGFASYKIVMALVLFGRGIWFAANHGYRSDWTYDPSPEPQTWDKYANAIFVVLFAYQGWENASFVAGEVNRNTKALRNGYYLAAVLVGSLYLLINVGFLTAFELVLQPTPGKVTIQALARNGYAAQFWGTPPVAGDDTAGQVSVEAVRAWAVLLTLSALGNIIAVTYTCGRVKQMIGQTFIFPWSRLWSRESRFNTPSGGLLLHCVCSLVLIVIAVSAGQIGLPGYLQAYSHAMAGFAVTVAFYFFEPPKKNGQEKYQWNWMRKSGVKWTFILVSLCMNLAMIVLPLGSRIPELKSYGVEIYGAAIYGGACFSAVAFSIIYYFALFPVEDYHSSKSAARHFSLLRLVGVSWKIDDVNSSIYNERWKKFERSSRKFDEEMTKVPYIEEQRMQFGERQMVYYALDGRSPGLVRRLAFWFFGGSFADSGIRNPLVELARLELPKIHRRRTP